MMKSTATRAEVRFKQLCCLGLGGEAVMPALLRELHSIIPFFCGNFFFAKESGALANICFDNPEVVYTTPIYMEEFHDRRDRELPGSGYADAMRTQFGVHDLERALAVSVEVFRRSDMYNVIYRRLGYASDFLRLVIREGRRGLGSLTLYRSAGTRPWSPEAKRRLAALEPFFAYALKQPSEGCGALTESDVSGLLVVDQAGALVYSSAQGSRLLFLATHARIAPDTVLATPFRLPAPVIDLCHNLSGIFGDDVSASAPIYHHRNVWGGFTFRAHWLNFQAPASGLIGITISHQEPLSVALMRRTDQLPLTRRQAQVCFLLAIGETSDRVAEKLGISTHTAITHARAIYEKLDVHTRAELVNRLLAA